MSNLKSFAAALVACSACAAFGDVTLGGTRIQSMGGAGLALPFDVANNYRVNPSFLAFGNKNPKLQFPQFGYRLDGISLSGVTDIVGKIGNGGLDSDGILSLARQYSRSSVTIGLQTNFGVQFGGLAISAGGSAGINSVPNAQLQNWANSGGDVNNVDLGSRLDAYGYATQQIEIAYGNAIRTKAGRLAVGVNTKNIKSYYAHKFADKDTIQSNNTNGIQNGSGIAGDFAESTSYGADLGLLYSPPNINNLYIGMVVENFITPSGAFPFESPGGGQPILQNGFDPFKRATSVGLGYQLDRFLLAADFVDLGNAAGRSEMRAGAELNISRGFALRAGYNSRTAFTYGVGFGSLNIQLGGNTPITIASVLRF